MYFFNAAANLPASLALWLECPLHGEGVVGHIKDHNNIAFLSDGENGVGKLLAAVD